VESANNLVGRQLAQFFARARRGFVVSDVSLMPSGR
jgi:hypothetical protein